MEELHALLLDVVVVVLYQELMNQPLSNVRGTNS